MKLSVTNLSLQQKKMVEIHKLRSQDLSYIYGESEAGLMEKKGVPQNVGSIFLQRGKDLESTEMKVTIYNVYNFE